MFLALFCITNGIFSQLFYTKFEAEELAQPVHAEVEYEKSNVRLSCDQFSSPFLPSRGWNRPHETSRHLRSPLMPILICSGGALYPRCWPHDGAERRTRNGGGRCATGAVRHAKALIQIVFNDELNRKDFYNKKHLSLEQNATNGDFI